MGLRSSVLTMIIVGGVIVATPGEVTGHSSTPVDVSAGNQEGSNLLSIIGQQTPSGDQPNNSTMFRQVKTNSSSFVIRLNMSLLTSFFKPGSVFRLVTGGTAADTRVIWFDIGIGYTGGSLLPNPLDEFVVNAEMSMNFPTL